MKLHLAALSLIALGACSAEQVTDNTVDAAKLTGKIVVNTAVGATKLAYRGSKAAYGAVQDARSPEGETFPPGAVLCSRGDGTYIPARQEADGSFACPKV